MADAEQLLDARDLQDMPPETNAVIHNQATPKAPGPFETEKKSCVS